MKRFFTDWLPVIVSTAIIAYLALLPGRNIPSAFSGWDAALHFLTYAFWGVCWTRAITHTAKYSPTLSLIILAGIVVFSPVTEIIQIFVPGRYVQISDWLANLAGALSFAALYLVICYGKRLAFFYPSNRDS